MENIRTFKLRNKGGFVARLFIEYRASDKDSWNTWKPDGYSDICAAAERSVDIADTGIASGSHVRLHAFVLSGSDRTASEEFIYSKDVGTTAAYNITGTTLINKLHFEGTN